jgi:hypothetical protein
MNSSLQDGTAMLVHGAWADGSCWNNVILPLRHNGLRVVAAPLPLTSLTDDAAALRRAIGRTAGPVILVAHAYAGAVIAAVKSLVYIAALTPDEGETVADVFYRAAPNPNAPKLAPDAYGLIWMPDEGFWPGCSSQGVARPHRHHGRSAAAIRCAMHSGKGPRSCVENNPDVVFRRGRGPHDQPGDPAIHGWPDECQRLLIQRRPHSYALPHRSWWLT